MQTFTYLSTVAVPITSRRICSSLFLQQLLYYNLFWSVAWLAAFTTRVCLRYGSGLRVSDPDAARTALACLWLLCEPLRLLAGYHGNLRENVPWLVVFAALCVAPQAGVCYYLMLAAWDRGPLDVALQIVMALFLHFETLAALGAVRRMFWAQQQQWRAYEGALRQAHERQHASAAAQQQQQLLLQRWTAHHPAASLSCPHQYHNPLQLQAHQQQAATGDNASAHSPLQPLLARRVGSSSSSPAGSAGAAQPNVWAAPEQH